MISGVFDGLVFSPIQTQISSKLALRYFVLGFITPKYPLDRFLLEANFDKGWPHFAATVNVALLCHLQNVLWSSSNYQ